MSYNEIYSLLRSGKYINKLQGMATILYAIVNGRGWYNDDESTPCHPR
jgi:hypothetical protein